MTSMLVAAWLILGVWTAAPGLNQPRAEIAAATLDGRIYVAGGFDPSGTDLASLEEFDPVSTTWQHKASMPAALNHLGVAALDGTLYVAGGGAGAGPTAGLYAYSPLTDTWTQKADLPLRRSAHAL